MNSNWFLRAYTTQENAGEFLQCHCYYTAVLMKHGNQVTAHGWYSQYAFAYLNAKMAGKSDITAHNTARAVADQGRPVPGIP